MELLPYADTEADLALTMELETDPEVMRELGGPHRREAVLAAHRRRAAGLGEDDWWLKIVPEPGGEPAGTIGVWQTTHDGEQIHEVGWMVLPRFQGRGIAGRALVLLIERMREAGIFVAVHAFPGVRNTPSNALCRKLGFTNLGEVEVVYAGRPGRSNHWVLDL